MQRRAPRAALIAAIAAAIVLFGGGLVPRASAVTPDPSDVVLVLDFSGSILEDAANRNRFAAALQGIADRIDQISADLVAGDATVSIVQFATRAVDTPGCVNLKLLGSPDAVGHFADCLRSVAAAYRKGLAPALTKSIGTDTNYVAAMERAASHLPAGAARPALILFTDGKHDVTGVPALQVPTTQARLFGTRSPFALLPVGMGLDPGKRDALAAGLERLRVIRDMPACVSGATFDWPQVVFETADQAGSAVAVALQNATCTFSVAPTPSPSPTPAPVPIRVQGIKLSAADGKIELTWSPVVTTAGASAPPVADYQARCRPAGGGDGDWIASTEGASPEPKATVEGLANGTSYECQVAAGDGSGTPLWNAAGSTTPLGRPAAPPKPTVEAQNRAVQVNLPAAASGVARYRIECSSDNGASWQLKTDAAAGDPAAQVGGLVNGTDYVCRVYAANAIGVSDASPLSDASRPCSSPLECNGLFLPVVGGLVALFLGGILVALVALVRGRTTGYVIAVVDVVHSTNVGHGSTLGLGFVRDPASRSITGIVADRGPSADIRIRRLRGGRFEVRDKAGSRVVADGDPVTVTDGTGGRHSLVLRAFATNAASRVVTRR